jgi:hypothetical protein
MTTESPRSFTHANPGGALAREAFDHGNGWATVVTGAEHDNAAGTRWAALRDRITLDRGIYDGYARDYDERGEYSHASRYLGRAAQCDALLAAMDEMEAGR